MSDAALTALVPVKTYHPQYLREAVDSLLAQTSTRWRALIIHTAGARTEVESHLKGAADDPRIALVEQRGRKLAGAINTGMREAGTDFTAILFGDDLWAPDAVEVLDRNIAARPGVDFFHSSRRIVDDNGEPVSDVHRPPDDVDGDTLVRFGSVKHLLCWRRGLALSIGGIDESLNSVGADDFDFPWSMMEAGARFAAIPECLYVYRDHRSCYRLTTHLPLRTHLRETRRIMRKHGVPEIAIRRHLAGARATYLRQCLYSSRLDAWIKRTLGDDPARGWRDSYL